MKKQILTLLLVLVSTNAMGVEQYFCVAEKATGFKYEKHNKEWVDTKFNANEKYIISKPELGKNAFVIHLVGESYDLALCAEPFNENGDLSCKSISEIFQFNRKTGRFLRSVVSGYFNVLPDINYMTDETSDTPFMEIGKCSPF